MYSYWATGILHYYTLNSNHFLITAKSVQKIFKIGARNVIPADYTIIMSRTLKVTGYVIYDRRT